MSHPRPACTDAVIKVSSASFPGQVLAVEPGRVMVGFAGDFPPTFALDDTVAIVLSGGDLPEPVTCDAYVVQRVEHDQGRRYILHFETPLFPDSSFPPPDRDRREYTRVGPPGETIAPIALVPLSRSGRPRPAMEQRGRLIDVSGGGLGVLLKARNEGPLTGHEHVRVTFSPPTTEVDVVKDCRIRGRMLTDHGIRMGLQFVEVDPKLVFEPLWDCTCGQPRLFERTHGHCPNCGNARTADAALVDWGNALPLSEHPFTGDAFTCPACGSTWSDQARFCGSCGTNMRRRHL